MGFDLVGLKFTGLICVCCCCFCQPIVLQLRPYSQWSHLSRIKGDETELIMQFYQSCEALQYKYSAWYSFLWCSLFRQPSSFVLYVFFPYLNPPFSLESIHQQDETVGAQSQYSVRERTLRIKYCLDGSGGPQIGAVTWRVTPRDQIKMRDYVDRRVTSPTWGPPD